MPLFMSPTHQRTSSRIVFALAFMLLAGGRADVASSATVTLEASKDNNLIENTAGAVSNGTGTLFAGLTGSRGPGALRALLAFDIGSGVPAGSTITAAELTLTVLQAGPGADTEDYSVHRVSSDWGEGSSFSTGGGGVASTSNDATWIHTFFDTDLWTNPGGDFEAAPSATQSLGSAGPETWGSTDAIVADVQSWLDDPSENYGWILLGDETRGSSARQFGSRESPTNFPQLTITFTEIPEPGSLGLLLFGVIVVISPQGRKRG